MPSKTVPQRSSKLDRITARRPRQVSKFTPFTMIIGGLILLVLILIGSGAWWVLERGKAGPTTQVTPTLVGGSASILLTPTTPAPTVIPSPQPSPTPIACVALRNTEAHAEPKVVTVKEPVARDHALLVFGKIQQEGILWYQVVLSGIIRYVPAVDVKCPIAP